MKNNNQGYNFILILVIYSAVVSVFKFFGIIISWLYVLLPIIVMCGYIYIHIAIYFIFIAIFVFAVVFYYSDEIDKDVE
jgi:hypothetical protein